MHLHTGSAGKLPHMSFSQPLPGTDLYGRRNRPIRQRCQALDSTKRPAGMRATLAVCVRVKVLSCYEERLRFLLFEEGLAGSHRDVVANGGPLSLISPGELAPLF